MTPFGATINEPAEQAIRPPMRVWLEERGEAATGDVRTETTGADIGPGLWVVLIVAGLGTIGIVAQWRRLRAMSPVERTLQRIGRRLGADRAARRAALRLARAHGSMTPATLLISRGALDAATQAESAARQDVLTVANWLDRAGRIA